MVIRDRFLAVDRQCYYNRDSRTLLSLAVFFQDL